MAASIHPCPHCGKPASDGGDCSYCLLRLGLDAVGALSSSRRPHSTLDAGRTPAAADRFLHLGVLPRFGDYELESEIARGGMGVVYRARQRSLNRVVAIKMILAGQLATPESVRRFRMEAEAAARLHHPGIVQIYEVGEHETQHFFSMELIDGVSLAECLEDFRVKRNGPAAERRQQELCVAELLARVARALDFAHRRGVLHRDLKPSNILIDEEGQPHLTDFGLAKLTGQGPSGLTLSSAVLGTPGYLAPEQAAGHADQVTTAADVYGLGATLYELLTGKPPFAGSTAVETMWMAVHQPPAPPRSFNPTLNRDLETVALKCLEKEPERRYRSAAAVADELERFIRREPIRARPVSRAEHFWRWCRRNPGLAALTSSLVVAILVGGGSALWQWRRAERANFTLTESVGNLEWRAIDDMLEHGQSSRALAQVGAMLRADPQDKKAAGFAMSVLEQRRFPTPVAPPIRHPNGAELSVARLRPDGRRIATASFDGTARIWDAGTSQEVVPPLQHQGVVTWAEFSPDGRTLATCSEDKTARLWDAETGAPRCEPIVHTEGVVRVNFSPDGRWLMTRTSRTVSIVDAVYGRMRIGPILHDSLVVAAGFRAGGAAFFTAKESGEQPNLRIWELPSGREKVGLVNDLLWYADVSEDLKRAVGTNHAGRAFVWDVGSAKEPRPFIGANGQFQHVVLSPDGDRLAAVGLNHWARIWDTTSALPATPEMPHFFLLNGVSFVDEGRSVLTWSADATARVWDARDGKPRFEPMRHMHRVNYAEAGRRDGHEVYLTTQSHLKSRSAQTRTGAAQLWQVRDVKSPADRTVGKEIDIYNVGRLSPDGRWIALTTLSQELWVVDVASGAIVCGPPQHAAIWGMMFTPDSRRLITTSPTGEVAMWSLPEGKLAGPPVSIASQIEPAEIAPDGKRFATGSADGMVRLWDTATGQVLFAMSHGSVTNSVDFSADGSLLASAGEDRVVRLWDTRTGKLVRELKGHQNEVMTAAFSPDGRRVVTASTDFTGRVFDVATGRQLFILPHQGEVLDACCSPDGRYIATGSRDRTVVIWDAATGRSHSRDLSHEQSVRNVRFSPDGKRLLTLDLSGLRLWDVATGHPLTVKLPQTVVGRLAYQCNGLRPAFTPDGERIFLAGGSPKALLWDVPTPPAGVPAWFPEFLEAVAGQRLADDTRRPEFTPPERFLELRRRLQVSTENDYYSRWTRHWLDSLQSDASQDRANH